MQSNIDYLSAATLSPEKTSWMEAFAPATTMAPMRCAIGTARGIPQIAGKALDLGCGAGLYSAWLVKRGWQVHALDLNLLPSIQGAKTMRHDLEKGIPFPDQTFDLALAWDVLEHLVEEKQMWHELARVLCPGGILLGSVPHKADERLRRHNLTFKHHIDKTHQREYSPKDIEEKMGSAQLTPTAIELKGPVSPQVISEFVGFKMARRPVALMVGAARRLGLLTFGELYADVFFAAKR